MTNAEKYARLSAAISEIAKAEASGRQYRVKCEKHGDVWYEQRVWLFNVEVVHAVEYLPRERWFPKYPDGTLGLRGFESVKEALELSPLGWAIRFVEAVEDTP